MGDDQFATFPADEGRTAGCISRGAKPVEPSATGTRVYLDVSPSIDAALSRVADAGGRVTMPKTSLPGDMGYFALIADTEGNVVGVHALN